MATASATNRAESTIFFMMGQYRKQQVDCQENKGVTTGATPSGYSPCHYLFIIVALFMHFQFQSETMKNVGAGIIIVDKIAAFHKKLHVSFFGQAIVNQSHKKRCRFDSVDMNGFGSRQNQLHLRMTGKKCYLYIVIILNHMPILIENALQRVRIAVVREIVDDIFCIRMIVFNRYR